MQNLVDESGRATSAQTSHANSASKRGHEESFPEVNVALSMCGSLVVLKAVPAFSELFLAAGSVQAFGLAPR